jgi:hypothetical protein
VSLTVTQAAPVITWATPASIIYGTALSGTQLNATASVPGVATFTTAGLQVGTHVIVPVYSGNTDVLASTASASSSGSNTVLITPLDFTLQVISSPTVEGIYGTTRQYTLHIAPIGGTFPGDVQFTTNNNGPLLSTYLLAGNRIEGWRADRHHLHSSNAQACLERIPEELLEQIFALRAGLVPVAPSRPAVFPPHEQKIDTHYH